MDEENEVLDKKAAKKAAKMKKKEEKKRKKGTQAPEEEEEESGGGKIVVALVSLIIIAIWVGILAMLIRLDVGGFGSTVLYPVFKDVPYINRILPDVRNEDDVVVDVQYPYATLDEAIARIKELETELDAAQKGQSSDSDTIAQLQAEITRLQEFEQAQAAFQEEKTKFYREVVFSDNAPDIKEYKAYYESIDAANAAELYKQVIQQTAYSAEVEEYASTFSTMKPKDAAKVMEEMTDDMQLVARILKNMDTESRANILGAMDATIAAQLAKLLEPSKP